MEDKCMAEYASSYAFGATQERLERGIEKAGMTIFARIDHAAAASRAGFQMPPTMVLLYGNPRVGTPLMLAAPQAALDLPLRVLVRNDSQGRTTIAFHPATSSLRMAGVPEALATRLEPAQRILIEALQPDLSPR